jgi:hypothetical protein
LETGYNAGKKHRDRIGHRAVTIALGVIKEPEDLGLHMRKHHRAIAIALGTMVALEGPDLRMMMNHRSATVLDVAVELDDQDHRIDGMTTHV